MGNIQVGLIPLPAALRRDVGRRGGEESVWIGERFERVVPSPCMA